MKNFPALLSFTTALLCLAAATTHSLADSPAIRFRLMPWDTTPAELFIASTTGYEQLRGQPNQLSHTYEYKGTSPLVLYRMEAQAGATPAFTPQQSLPLSTGTSSYILLLFRATAQGVPQHAVLYPFDQTDSFRAGLTIFNFTAHPVAAQIGEQVVNLNARQSHFIAAEALPLENYSFLCKIAGNKANRWRLVYNNFISIPPRSNVLFFITADSATPPESDDLKVITKRVVDYNLSEATRKQEIGVERIGTDINY